MIIEVTKDHIAKAVRGSWGKCPIELAVKDKGAGGRRVGDYLTVCGIEYQLPYEAAIFILNFDMGYNVEPFTFEVTL